MNNTGAPSLTNSATGTSSARSNYAMNTAGVSSNRTDYVHNEELPIGFTMELAQHSDILSRFSGLSETEQRRYIDGARSIKSRSEMRSYVESMF